MANPTTNYSFAMPTNTDLVKDLPADFDIFGQAVDDRIKALNPETTLGDIAYRSSTANVKTRLGLGTAGQVLAVNSGATAPEWKTVSSGGMTLISETVASALSSLSFSSLGSYKQLFMIWSGIRHSDSTSIFAFRFNNSSSTIYTSGGYINDASPAYSETRTSIRLATPTTYYSFGEGANASGLRYDVKGSLLIDNYTSTTKGKSYRLTVNYYNNDASTNDYRTMNVDGYFDSTSAITSIDIVRLGGTGTFSNTTDSTIRLYGLS
jgi:hypothetical protein